MSARTKTSSVNANSPYTMTRLGIFAGGGELPCLLINYCMENQIEPFIIGFKGQTEVQTYGCYPALQTRIGASGSILKWLHRHDIKDVVFIGSIKRPSLWTVIPDFTTLVFFLKLGLGRFNGDNKLLESARDLLDQQGVKLHGIHHFLPTLLMPKGDIGSVSSDQYLDDIKLGIAESQKLGAADIGQAVIIKNGKVLGRENQKGTNVLVRQYGQEGAVLVKTKKPQQGKDLDLPTAGINTLRYCAEKKMAGIALHADNALLIDRQAVVAFADSNALFVTGIDVPS